MKISITRALNYFDIGPDYRVTLGSLFRVLQEASSKHSDIAENGMTATGRRWVLNRLSIEIDRYPVYGETVTAATWHRASKGYKAYRDYELFSGGTRVAAATTIWLYYDLDAARLLKVPRDTGEKYGVVAETATRFDLEGWKPETEINPRCTTQITTRPSDYDPLRHVNNAVYLDYLSTVLFRNNIDPGRINTVCLQYNKQIGQDVEMVEAGFDMNGNVGKFKFYDNNTAFAAGKWEFS